MKQELVHDLLYEALETDLGGIEVYDAALRCAQNDDLRREWERYREATTEQCAIMRSVVEAFGLDPDAESPNRMVARHIGESLVLAMDKARRSAPPEAAELVATECVTFAEAKDQLNWELMGEVAAALQGEQAEALQGAVTQVEDHKDGRHTSGWSRELWMDALGLPAALPPPDEPHQAGPTGPTLDP